MSKVKVTKIKSTIGSSKRQKRTMEALGLSKMNSIAEHNVSPQIEGMIAKINHLVKVEYL